MTFQLSGYGIADGKYLVDKCSHKIGAGGAGYTVSAEGHKALVGYGGSGSGPGTGSSGGTGGGGNENAKVSPSAGNPVPLSQGFGNPAPTPDPVSPDFPVT